VNLLYKIPQDIFSVSPIKSFLAGSESPKVDKSLSPLAEKSAPEPSKAASPKSSQGSTGAEGAPTFPSYANSSHDAANISPRPEPTEILETSPPCPHPIDSGHPMGHRQAKVRLCLHPEHNCDRFRVRQSPCGTILISSRPDFTSAGMLGLP
jgi:hypothetical protein